MNYTLVSSQIKMQRKCDNPDLSIHIGEMSDEIGKGGTPRHTWRVSEDGYIADRFRSLDNVFEMSEEYFFDYYTKDKSATAEMPYYKACLAEIKRVEDNIPELPFSHIWIASKMSKQLPKYSVLHLGILSPLRSWSYFDIDSSIEVSCNQGGFGIDGNMSTLIGASLVNKDKLYFAVVGDLSFFYDINVIGNRHVKNSVRILLINNSQGAEFKLFKQVNCTPVNDIENFISAGGHNGHQSPLLVKHIAEDLGFEYLTASSKEEFDIIYQRFVKPEHTDKPIIFEIFTDVKNENQALYDLWTCIEDKDLVKAAKETVKNIAKDVFGANSIKKIHEIKDIITK